MSHQMKTCLQSVTLVAERVLQINLLVHNEILEFNHFIFIYVHYNCVKFRCLNHVGLDFNIAPVVTKAYRNWQKP